MATSGSVTILVVDDDQTVLHYIETCLARTGQQIATASRASEALAMIAKHHRTLRLLVADVDMPAISGIKLAEMATRNYPLCKVLLISGLPAPPEVQQRGWTYLAKPFKPEPLLRAVETAIGLATPRTGRA